jgi:DNA repair protein RadC
MEGDQLMLYQKYEFSIVRRELNPRDMRIETPVSAVDYFKEFAIGASNESLFVVVLDGRNNLIGIQEVYRGTATGTSVRIAELFTPVLLSHGVGMVVVHNHPSGDHEPSDEDKRLTVDIVKAARIMDIEMLDHLVIGKDKYTSIRSIMPNIWQTEFSNMDMINDILEG